MKLARNISISILMFFLLSYALIWLLSPWLVRTFAADSLAEYKIELHEQSKVRLNLFNSSLNIKELSLLQENQTPFYLDELQIQYSFWSLFKKEVHIKGIHLKDMQLDVNIQGDQILVAGIDVNSQEPTIAGEQENQVSSEEIEVNEIEAQNVEESFVDSLSYIAPEILLENIKINVLNEGSIHKVVINHLELKQSEYRNQKLVSIVDLDAKFDDAAIVLNTHVTVDGEIIDAKVSVDVQKINTSFYQYLLPDEIEKFNAYLNLKTKMNVNLNGDLLKIEAGELNFSINELEAREKTFDASLESIELNVPEFSANFNIETVIVQAQAKMDLKLADLNVGLTDTETVITKLDGLSTSEIQINLDDVNYEVSGENITLNGLLASKVNKTLPEIFNMQSIEFNKFNITPELVMLDNINLGAGQSFVSFDAEYNVLTLLDTDLLLGEEIEQAPETVIENEQTLSNEEQELDEEQDLDEEQESTETELLEPRIQLRQIVLSEPLNIMIEDKSTTTDFKKTFIITDLVIDDIDSGEIDKKTNYKIRVTDEDYFIGDASGWITIFSEKLNLDTRMLLTEFSMQEVAPYLKDSLGFEVTAGQLDLDYQGTVTNDQLKSDAVILLRGAKFGESQKVEGSNLIGKTAIPLNVALGMLRDRQGNIELKIPVNGDVYDPSFGVRNVVGLVIKKVAMQQVKSQLLNAFVPYSKVVSVALNAGSFALKVRFEDLNYTQAQVEISEEQMQFVNQISTLMKDKEKLSVRVCPVATKSEIIELNKLEQLAQVAQQEGETTPVEDEMVESKSNEKEIVATEIAVPENVAPEINVENLVLTTEQFDKLANLAKKRGDIFKALLVEQGVDSSRLLLCSPKVDEKDKGLPRIEFGT